MHIKVHRLVKDLILLFSFLRVILGLLIHIINIQNSIAVIDGAHLLIVLLYNNKIYSEIVFSFEPLHKSHWKYNL
jgi:hypothetical protein